MKKIIGTLVVTAFVSGCTSMSVSKLDATKYPVKTICIEENPAVAVADLVPFLEKSIQERGIQTLLYKGKAPPQCEYTLWYTAFRGWDLAPYLNRAEFRRLRRDRTPRNSRHPCGTGNQSNL